MFRRKKKIEEQVEVYPIYRVPSTKTSYPSGTVIKTESGTYYVKGGKRYRIISDRVLDSWDFPRIIGSSDAAAAGLKVSGRLGLREGTLINNITNGKMYLISENKKRQITNPDWLEILNYSEFDALLVSDEEANLHEDGEELK